MEADDEGAPLEPLPNLCQCVLVSAHVELSAHLKRIGAVLDNQSANTATTTAALREMQREWKHAAAAWRAACKSHDDYREVLTRQLLEMSKARSINSDFVAGAPPLQVSAWTSGSIRAARQPLPKKAKKDRRANLDAALPVAVKEEPQE